MGADLRSELAAAAIKYEWRVNMNGRAAILLVDDEAPIVRFATMALENRGYKVYAANGAQEALRTFGDHIDEIDLVLSDIKMPDMSGLEMASIMRQQRPNLPLLFISGWNDPLPDWASATCGLLTKPFIPKQLFEAIEECLEGTRRAAKRSLTGLLTLAACVLNGYDQSSAAFVYLL